MIFTPAPTDINYDVLRLESETGRWEFGLRQMIFGVRVCAGIVGSGCYTVDYCAGADIVRIDHLRQVVQQILEGQPESVTAAEVWAMLPAWKVRPMHNDPQCFSALVELARQARAGGA